jgi:uracil-DNA glycosylase family 4
VSDHRQCARDLKELQREILESNVCSRLVEYCSAVAQRKRAMFSTERYWGKAVPSFGDPAAELVIIGLAPAAHGGNRTGRVFTGDRSGDFLFRALYEAGFANQSKSMHRNDGLKLTNCYITTVVRWAPPQNKPTPMEIRQCLPFLQRELELLWHTKAVLVFASGIVVDTHAFRVATRRLRLSQAKTPARVEQDLLRLVPRNRWIQFSYQFTLFGRNICTARHPRCAECPLEAICDSSEKTV